MAICQFANSNSLPEGKESIQHSAADVKGSVYRIQCQQAMRFLPGWWYTYPLVN